VPIIGEGPLPKAALLGALPILRRDCLVVVRVP
jgi:hypothetical protein